LAEFFFCLFINRDVVEVHKLAKKERGQCPAILTEQAWSIKDLLYGFWGNFSCGTRRVVPTGQESSISPARVANHSSGFDGILPAQGASHIIKYSYFDEACGHVATALVSDVLFSFIGDDTS